VNLSAKLRAEYDHDWAAAVGHRFVDDIWRGALPAATLRTYLVQDNQFLDAFVALLGAAVAAADRAEGRMVHARQLGVLAGPENDFFARAFDVLDVPLAERSNPPLLPPTVAFAELMHHARRSADYPTCLAVLVVAEWLYLDWATRPGAEPPDEPVQREWIELHRGPAFEAWVGFLRSEFDRVTARLDAGALAAVTATFGRAVELERAFFDAVHPG